MVQGFLAVPIQGSLWLFVLATALFLCAMTSLGIALATVLHPEAEDKPVVIGNYQAGWQVMRPPRSAPSCSPRSHRRLAAVLLVRRARQEPRALCGRAARRELAWRGSPKKRDEFGMGHMDAEKKAPPSQAPAAPRPALRSDGVIAQLMTLLRALAGSRRRRQLGLLALGVVVVICANAAGQIRLNIWQRDFYEAIEQRHMAAFITQLMVFAVIAGGLLVLVVSQTWLQAMVNVRLREWLTHDLLDQWLVRKRVYLLGFAGEIGVNPDQRIQQDAQHLTELTTILAIGLLQSSLLLVSFAGVLWVLSDQVVFDFGERPGYDPGVHGLVRARLFARRIAARLARRPPAHSAQ